MISRVSDREEMEKERGRNKLKEFSKLIIYRWINLVPNDILQNRETEKSEKEEEVEEEEKEEQEEDEEEERNREIWWVRQHKNESKKVGRKADEFETMAGEEVQHTNLRETNHNNHNVFDIHDVPFSSFKTAEDNKNISTTVKNGER